MADDLDDEWWQNDAAPSKPDTIEDDEDEAGDELKDSHVKNDSSKRKLEEEEGTVTEEKKKKKRKRKKITDELAAKPVKPLHPQDVIEELNKFFSGKLSGIEQEELNLDGEVSSLHQFPIFNSSTEADHFGKCNPSPADSNACSFLLDLLPKWKKMLKASSVSCGSPLLLVVSSSGIRCANLNRDTKLFKTDNAKSAKLFAKHMKLQEQVKFLESKPVHIGFGTPNRLISLLDTGALKLDAVKYIVLDWSNRDSKLRRMIDIPEVKKDLCLLMKKYFIPHVKCSESITKVALL